MNQKQKALRVLNKVSKAYYHKPMSFNRGKQIANLWVKLSNDYFYTNKYN